MVQLPQYHDMVSFQTDDGLHHLYFISKLTTSWSLFKKGIDWVLPRSLVLRRARLLHVTTFFLAKARVMDRSR